MAVGAFGQSSVPASPQTSDFLEIRNADPPPQTPLALLPGKRTRITVTVNYVLSSADRASLAVFAEEYPDAAGGCRGDLHQTDGANSFIIQRGKGVASTTVIWPANPSGDPMPKYPKGYVTLGAIFWTPDGTKVIRFLGLHPEICYHFAPLAITSPNGPNPSFGQSDSVLPAEFAAMRSALCDKPSDFVETGCRVCPKFMAKSANLGLHGGLGINGVLFGSFTSVGKTEALLLGFGCFAHADGFASSFLLRKEQGSWQRLSYFHNEGPVGICQKIPGQGDMRDLLVCNFGDWGKGDISVIAFDADGKVKTESQLVQTWTFPFRSVEKQKHCSSLQADVKEVSFNSIEISIFPNSFDADPPIICDDESYGTTSEISNSKKFEAIAVFIRNDDNFAPDEKTKKLLSELEKSR